MDLEQIIVFQKECRETHVLWIEAYKRHPEYLDDEELVRRVGPPSSHEDCVRGYDATIELLEKLGGNR